MKGINKVILIGNLGKEPEIQYIEGNIAFVKFSLATTESYKDKTGNIVSQTEWHSLVAWRGIAEMVYKNLHKGNLVYVEGRLRSRSWEDKDTKIKRNYTEIMVDNIIMLDRKKEATEYGAAPLDTIKNNNFSDSSNASDTNENLPF